MTPRLPNAQTWQELTAKLPRMSHKYESERELIARVILIDENCLLVNEGFSKKLGQGYFALPGGHVDPGESCAEAVARECREELEIEVEIADICFVCEQIYDGRGKSDDQRHELTLLFRGELKTLPHSDGDKILSPEADKNFRWLPLSELSNAPILPRAVKQFLMHQNTALYAFHDET